MRRKKPKRKVETTPKRGIAWPRWTGFCGMTVRDWLQLLIVPFVLAVVGFWFTAQQNAHQRELEEQRAQDAALQAYLDQMSTLLIENNLRTSEEGSEVRTLARARTLTILERLDPDRKARVLQYLYESGLVAKEDKLVVNLYGADLSRAHLSGAHLPALHLTGADLSGTEQSESVPSGTDPYSDQLRAIDPAGAERYSANLPSVDLSGAELRGAVLTGAELGRSDLSGADLSNAHLASVDLTGADLTSADLAGADLRRAILTDARITNEQLDESRSLEGATMPNGQKYEDWLKSKD